MLCGVPGRRGDRVFGHNGMSFAAWLVMLVVGVWRFAVSQGAGVTFAKDGVNQLTAWATGEGGSS